MTQTSKIAKETPTPISEIDEQNSIAMARSSGTLKETLTAIPETPKETVTDIVDAPKETPTKTEETSKENPETIDGLSRQNRDSFFSSGMKPAKKMKLETEVLADANEHTEVLKLNAERKIQNGDDQPAEFSAESLELNPVSEVPEMSQNVTVNISDKSVNIKVGTKEWSYQASNGFCKTFIDDPRDNLVLQFSTTEGCTRTYLKYNDSSATEQSSSSGNQVLTSITGSESPLESEHDNDDDDDEAHDNEVDENDAGNDNDSDGVIDFTSVEVLRNKRIRAPLPNKIIDADYGTTDSDE